MNALRMQLLRLIFLVLLLAQWQAVHASVCVTESALTTTVSSSKINSLALQQARAYQAARAGLEWGISRAVNAGSCSNSAVSMAGGGLSEFTVSLTCNSTSHTDDDGSGLTIYRLTAQAQNGAPGSRPDYAFRRLTAVVER